MRDEHTNASIAIRSENGGGLLLDVDRIRIEAGVAGARAQYNLPYAKSLSETLAPFVDQTAKEWSEAVAVSPAKPDEPPPTSR